MGRNGSPATTLPAYAAVLVTAADGAVVEPRTSEEWEEWVAAGGTRNALLDDRLVDWLGRYGRAAGFEPDDAGGVDPRTDFRTFVFERGSRFEAGVVALIAALFPVTTIATGPADARSLDAALATLEALRAGVPVVAQGVLRDPTTRTYGVADLLVRADVVEALVPGSIPEDELTMLAPALGPNRLHYRAIDIKYRTLVLTASGAASPSEALHYQGQVWLYNEALGRLQGVTPPAAYLLGRSARGGGATGSGCFERLARVERAAVLDAEAGTTLGGQVADAVDWLRRLRREGSSWQVLPEPTVPELLPNLRTRDASGWSRAVGRIARELEDVTLLPGVTVARRRVAHEVGLRRWTDPRVTGESLGAWEKVRASCDAVLAANRSPVPVVLPERIEGDAGGWRTPRPVECYVDFETSSDVDDDLSHLPARGGMPLIFQIGCGRWVDGEWRFDQWTVDRLTEPDERRIIEAFIGRIETLRQEAGVGWDGVRLIHWWSHEPGTLDTYDDSARHRHGDPDWPRLPWFDFLTEVVRPTPVTVTGAFDFGLKSLAKAMHAAGLIETTWGDGPGDGSAAQVGAWWCEAEAARIGGSIRDLELMDAIAAYNEVDCRAMAEVVRWLRRER